MGMMQHINPEDLLEATRNGTRIAYFSNIAAKISGDSPVVTPRSVPAQAKKVVEQPDRNPDETSQPKKAVVTTYEEPNLMRKQEIVKTPARKDGVKIHSDR